MQVEQPEMDAIMAALAMYRDLPEDQRKQRLRDYRSMQGEPKVLTPGAITALRDRLHLCAMPAEVSVGV